ncbi:MFS transporter [Pseudonocardia acidicola]|uniref:MFS transporter n=1 Tax=Pseudonocardia acidicola TaxID=2724939 RepID=A0ABX1SDN6_9PSEU|nr:MFS transporter [Pseudonocardia acidicola]NMH98308.1 MFS transporter [Pseudonocardia acidicola]
MSENRPGDATRRPPDGTSPNGPGDDVLVVDASRLKRTIAGTAVGNMMEWYDFGVYSYVAVTLGKVFFPGSSGPVQLISTFATFAAAFLIRPLGGFFFGPLGDRIGRKRVLATTMILMAIGTFCIGLLPGYDTIGIWAPILLLVVRLVQGFSTGGEYGSAMTFISEHSPDRRRGFLSSWLEFGTLSGYVLGAAIATGLTATLTETQMLSWGWRIPFFVAGPLGLAGLYMRLKLEETPAFEYLAGHEHRTMNIREEFRRIIVEHRRPVLVCMGLVLVWNVTNYMLTSYMPNYLSTALAVPEATALLVVLIVMAVLMVVITFVGRLSDRVGRRPVLMTGCILLILGSVPAMLIIRNATFSPILIGCMLMGLMLVCFSSTEPATLPALFPTDVRAGALSVAFNISVSLFGGTTPLVTAALVTATHSLLMPGFYLMAAGIIGAVAVLFAPETAGRPLPGSPPVAADEAEARKLVGY